MSVDPHGSHYASAGVDYEVLDRAKRTALAAADASVTFSSRRSASFDTRSFGEPASVVEIGGVTLATVLECLGTKSVLACEFEKLTGVDRYDAIGYDTVAAIVNDCICVGALPFIVNAYFATGSADFYNGSRHTSLVAGFLRGCDAAGATWGGGESPTLAGLIAAEGIDLAGSAVGRVPQGRSPIFGTEIGVGDAIVLVESSGLHQNGASLGRKAASEIPKGLTAELPSGRMFGDALLDEGLIYVGLVEALLESDVGVHYLSHLTGHGLRKLMRADRALTYRIRELPPVPEVIAFLAEQLAMSDAESYGTLNMGAGFAVIVSRDEGDRVVEIARHAGHRASVAGVIEEGPRRVILEQIGVVFGGESLALR
ncbi:MAG TPA: AIR synthase-related protein [Acidimicrobiales bacterium]|nr:AIR synthase-related protein [Acidimicrobiales bacterium]